MLSRRRFLQTSSLAAAAVLPAKGVPEDRDELPPAIAALPSLRAEVVPISTDERHARQEKARALMKENGLSAILLTEGTSLIYFSGIRWWGAERLFAMVLPVKGDAFYVCPGFEEDRGREQITKGLPGSTPDVRIWQEHESPYQRVAQGLSDRGIATASIGVEETVKFVFSDNLRRATTTATWTSATPVTAGCRMIKSRHELDLMRLGSKATLMAYEATYRSIKPGMTHQDVKKLVEAAHSHLGFEGSALVLVDEFSAFPHGSVTPQVLREGSIVLIDGGCDVEGYESDISRTFVLGRATARMKEVFGIVRRAQDAALTAAKPGVECGAVDAAARKVIIDSGFGPDYKYFMHRVGHGMGMDVHEWPYLVRGNGLKLQPNMTFSDEPGIYIRGEFGVRLEDDMHITETGAELFTPQSRSLEDPFGKG